MYNDIVGDGMENNKVLFMVLDNQVVYLQNSNMDHREWFVSLGKNPDEFDNVIRGFIMDGKIVFFKGMNFNYDQGVIDVATKVAPSIRITLQNPSLEVYCGIVINSYGEKWEPVLKINEEELVGYLPKQEEKKESVSPPSELANGPILELKNNYNDDKFVQLAIRMTTFVLIIFVGYVLFSIIFHKNPIPRLDYFLWFLEIFLLIFTIYGYKKKLNMVKYIAMVASVLLLLMFHPFSIILGVFYLLFNVDHSYIISLFSFFKKIGKKKSS